MRLLRRIFVIVLFAALAAAPVARMPDTDAMNIKMALAGNSGMNMADCKGCPDDSSKQNAMGCVSMCTLALMILPQSNEITFLVVADRPYDLAERGFTGRTGPPEPHPPRIVISS